jgi:hypothetical protein
VSSEHRLSDLEHIESRVERSGEDLACADLFRRGEDVRDGATRDGDAE